MTPGFHLGSLPFHSEVTALEQLAQLGFHAAAIRPRRGGFDPESPQFIDKAKHLARVANERAIELVIDADAWFYHDPWRREPPSLGSEDAAERETARQWLQRLIGIAEEIGARLVTTSIPLQSSMASATSDRLSAEVLDQLGEQLSLVVEFTSQHSVDIAIRPRQNSAIPSVAKFERLLQWMSSPAHVKLCADIGEMIRSGELPLSERLNRNADHLACVYFCDLTPGVAQDQRIGKGDVNFQRIIASLMEQRFEGPVIVRVDGHQDAGLTLAQESLKVFSL